MQMSEEFKQELRERFIFLSYQKKILIEQLLYDKLNISNKNKEVVIRLLMGQNYYEIKDKMNLKSVKEIDGFFININKN